MGGGGKVIGRRRPYSQGAGTGDIKRCDARKDTEAGRVYRLAEGPGENQQFWTEAGRAVRTSSRRRRKRSEE
jgi:hypothetical protein